jgi:tape measure domain-containing protein
MSEKIKSEDIFEGEIFQVLVDGAKVATEKVAELNAELVKTGLSFKKELKSSKPESVKDIEALIASVKKLNAEVDKQIKLNTQQAKLDQQLEKIAQEQEKVNQQKLKSLQEQEKLAQQSSKTKQQNIKLTRDETKEEERLTKELEKKKKVEKDLADAYKQLTINTRDLKNESKRLGAEMLELEKQGKKNSAEYYKLSRQYKETTKSAIEGDKALKKLDSTVGDNFRNVGNYQKAIGGLKNALMQLGLAFGVFDGIRWLFETQVKLDSLSLALKNVSGSASEYSRNFAFLSTMSKKYGQDLLVLIDTYKNFIASSESSNISLVGRKRIYESVIKAGSALALSNQDVEGALRAVSQMFSKGTVASEELRQQLGERLPGAFKMMAKSMGVTEIELNKMLKNGEVLADDVLPAFARELDVAFGKNAEEKLKTVSGAFNNLKTNITLYFDKLQKGFNANKSFAFVLNGIANNIGTLINTFGNLFRVFLLYKGSVILLTFLEQKRNKGLLETIANIFGLTTATEGAEKSTSKLGKAMKGLGGALQALSIAVIAELSYYLYKSLSGVISIEDRIDRLNKQTEIGLKKTNTFIDNMYDKSNKAMVENMRLFKAGEITKEEYRKREKQSSADNLQSLQTYYVNLKDRQKELLADRAKLKPDLMSKRLYIGGEETQKIASKYGIKADTFDFGRLRTDKVYNQLTASLQATYEQEKILNTEILETGKRLKSNKKVVEETNKTYAQQDKKIIEINTEYKTTTDYLSRHLELMIDIAQFRADSEVIKAQEEYNKALENQQKILERTGEYGFGSIYYASQEEQKAMIIAEQNQYDAKKLKRDIDYKEKYKDLQDNLDKEKEANIKNAEEIETLIALKRKNAQAVSNNKSSSASAKQTAKDNLRWANEQENKLAVDKLAIEQNYQNAKRKIEEEAKKEKRDLDEEEKNDLEKLRLKKEEIIRKSEEKISKDQSDLEKERAEMRLEVIKNTAESVNNLIQKSLEHYIDLAERRIDILDKRMDRMSTQADFLREKAVSGNIQAQESLAQLDVQQMEADKQRINEQKSIQKLQIAMTIFQAYSNNIQSAKVTENPFTKTFTEITALGQLAQAISNGMPAYFDGTEDTGSNGQGVDGKGGFHAVLHPNERVIPKALNSKIGDLSNLEIAKLAEDFHRGEVMRKGDGAMQLNVGSWSTDAIVSKLESLENTIKNKPESNIELGEIVGGVMHIMETKKTGNTKVRNISRFS